MNMENSTVSKIKPMGLIPSLLFFGIPSLIFSFFIYYVMQELHRNGINDFVNWIVSMTTPLALMLVAAVIAFKAEGNSFNRTAFLTRFRLKKMSGKDWIYTIALFIVTVIIYGALSSTSKWLIQFKLFSPPEFLLPAVDPGLEHNILVDSFMGIPLKDNGGLQSHILYS